MIYEIRNANYSVKACDLGGELSGFADLRDGYEYIWQRGEEWNGQAPLLFPIVGRLKENIYELDGVTYGLEKHGIARRSVFELESHSDTEMTFLLRESEETLKKYPFAFELRAHYAMLEDGFVVEYRVKNTNDRTMYFSMGAHPAFHCEMGDRIVMDEPESSGAYRIRAIGSRTAEKDPVFANSREVVIEPHSFDLDALIFDDLRSDGATLVRANGRNVHVGFGGAPCLGIWAKPGAPFVCIEPWYGIDDRNDAGHDFTRKEQIRTLEPGEEFVFPVTVRAV